MQSEHDLMVTQRGVQKLLRNGRISLGPIRGTLLRVQDGVPVVIHAEQVLKQELAHAREIVMVVRWIIRGAGILLSPRRVHNTRPRIRG